MNKFIPYIGSAVAGSAATTPAGVIIARCADNKLHNDLEESNKTLIENNKTLTAKNKSLDTKLSTGFALAHEEYILANKDKNQGLYRTQVNGVNGDTALCWITTATYKSNDGRSLQVYSCYEYKN